MVLALFAGLLSLGMRSLPPGSVLCIGQDGHVALESTADTCCLSTGTVDEHSPSTTHPSATDHDSCENCVDFVLPHGHVDVSLTPMACVWPATPALSVVAVIVWPRECPAHQLMIAVPTGRPRHLVEIATVIIRC